MTTLEGKRILVMGAGGRQGRVGARLLAEHGARLVLADAVAESANAAAAEARKAGGTAVAASADVSDAAS